ncbi:uncharacterized protein LOC108738450 isoform X2 [Agrilus planipennis]|uniref:Uncharacterized protein LOC108738450 isoform X2 n=1 Tax=Agrilus planipennis TaxID=224129 RepID=A0A1W4X4R7_AGRPL|nr:uncharacterized protein LOC108738450 isoform X2 [Agrilus planipennis]
MIISIQNPRKTVFLLIKKMVQKEHRLRRLGCVRKDIFRNWGLTKNWYLTMSKQGNSSPGFNFNPSNTYYGRADASQEQQNIHLQGETERPSSEARSEGPPVEHHPQNSNEGTGFRAITSSPLTNLSHTLESRLPLNNHEPTPSRTFRTPSVQRGFAQNIFSGIGIPISRASFLPCNARAEYEAWQNRNQENTMYQFARNVPAHSTGNEEMLTEEEGSESEGVGENSGEMPVSPIQREEPVRGLRVPRQFLQPNVSSMNSGGTNWDRSPTPRSNEFYQSPSPQSDDLLCSADRPTRGLRTSPSPQSSNLRSYSPTPTSDALPQSPFSFEAAREVQHMMSFDKYDGSRTLPAQSTARGQLPQFHETFGSPIQKEAPVRVPRVPYQYIRPNVSKQSAAGKRNRSGSVTPHSDEVCESPSIMSEDIEPSRVTMQGGVRYPEPRRLFQGSPFKYGVDSTMPFQSTAIGQLPQYHESFGSAIVQERPMRGMRTAHQYMQPNISRIGSGRSASPRSDEICGSPSPQSGDLRSCSRSPQSGDVRSHSASPTSEEVLKSKSSDRLGGGASPKRSYQMQCGIDENEESFLERFDKAVEKELERYRIDGPADASTNISMPRPLATSDSQALDSVTSSIEIISRMKGEQDTELTEAVEKLAKAEATVMFQGAIEAAEKAAANAPPEFAEEAAAASARAHAKIYNAELTNVVHEAVPGVRPIEIVGYVGVTRPKKPLRP